MSFFPTNRKILSATEWKFVSRQRRPIKAAGSEPPFKKMEILMSNPTFDTRLGSGHPKASFIFIAVMLLAAWFGFILMLGDAGSFHAGPNEPPLATLLAMLLPPTLFLVLLLNPGIRASVLSIDPVWVTAMQGLRILGAGFLVAYAFGHLPGLFAHIAGWGDVLVALLAPFMVAHLAANRAFIRSRWYFRFHVLGLLDFVGAVVSGLLARGTIPFFGLSESTAALSQFPLLLIPCFAVPLWICLHITAFMQIRQSRRALKQ